MKVLLTGAPGNIGEYTIPVLLEEGHDVIAFDLQSPRSRGLASRLDPRVRVAWGDLCDPASLRAALRGVEGVVHLAAIIPPHVDKAPDLARRVNVDGTRPKRSSRGSAAARSTVRPARPLRACLRAGGIARGSS
jgi:nucleoside-diphosphate-sugar epimerase